MKMKNHFLLIFILLILSLGKTKLCAQTPTIDTAFYPDFRNDYLRGIPINKSDFNALVFKFRDIMQRGDSIKTINDCITLVKLTNTIAYEGLFLKHEDYKQLLDLFDSHYLMPTANKLEAQISKGQGFYSVKYSIGIGGPPPDDKDFFYIVTQ